MNFVKDLKNRTVSISDFNKGLAGKIFNDVKKNGTKVVLKNNSEDCILISPEDYISLLEELEDAKDIIEASKRLEEVKSSDLVSAKEFEDMTDIHFSNIEIISEDEFEWIMNCNF